MITRVVLDTSVVLDWLVFNDPSTSLLADRIDAREVTVIAHELTVGELRRVLEYPKLELSSQRRHDALARFVGIAQQIAMPESFSRDRLMLPMGFPRCRDNDDDVFLAVAYHGKTDALVTKDKALLKLKKKAMRFGARIVSVPDLYAMLSAIPQ